MPAPFPYRPSIIRLSELLKRDFNVPPYQRPYVWKEENARGLLLSLIKASEQGDPEAAPCRLGTVILVTDGRGESWEIIDGQQRIITLFLILTAISERGILEGPLLESSKRGGGLEVRDGISLAHIAKNYRSISSFLSLVSDEGLRKLARAIEAKAEVLAVEATFERGDLKGREELLRLFHDQNARGKDLSVADRLKAIHLAKIADPGIRRQKAALFERINRNEDGVDHLIEKLLFPIRRWGRRQSAAPSLLGGSDAILDAFRGVDPGRGYPYARFQEAGSETRRQERSWQFDQPFLAGEGFFDLLERASSDFEKAKTLSAPRAQVLKKKIYENLYLPSLAYLINRFGEEGLQGEPAAWKFALAIDLWLKMVRSESIDKYARGYALSAPGSQGGFPLFETIASVSSPGELIGTFLSAIPFPREEEIRSGKEKAQEAFRRLPRIDLPKDEEAPCEENTGFEGTEKSLREAGMEEPTFVPLLDEGGANVFDRDCFIPSYQRDFAWDEEDETAQLIDDLLNVNGERYLIGSFVFSKKIDDRGHEYLEVVDGQQRLTVLYLLFRVLGIQVAHPLAYESGRESLLKAEEGGDGSEARTYRYLAKRLRSEEDKKRVISNLKKTYVLRDFLPPKTDLNNYFETMNGTGVDLGDADLVKALVYERLAAQGQGKADDFASLFNRAQSFFSGECGGGRELERSLSLKEASAKSGEGLIDDSKEETASSPIDFRLFLLYVLLSIDGEACPSFNAKKLVENFEHNFGNGAKEGGFAEEFLAKFKLDLEILEKCAIRRRKEGGFSFPLLDRCKDDSLRPTLKRVMMLQEAACQLPNFFRKDGWVLQLLRKGAKGKDIEGEELEEMLLAEFREATKAFLKEAEQAPTSIPPFSVLYFLDYLIWKKMAQGKGEEAYVAGQRPFDDIASFSFGRWRSIEHFYPQHPANKEAVDPEENVSLFGNLALLPKAENSRFSNNMPSSKIKNFGSRIAKMSLKLRLMARAVGTDDEAWRKALSEKDESKRDPLGREMLSMLKEEVGWKEPSGH